MGMEPVQEMQRRASQIEKDLSGVLSLLRAALTLSDGVWNNAQSRGPLSAVQRLEPSPQANRCDLRACSVASAQT